MSTAPAAATHTVVPSASTNRDQSVVEVPLRSQNARLHAGTPRLSAETPASSAAAGQRQRPSGILAATRAAPPETRATRSGPRRRRWATSSSTASATSTQPSTAAGVRSNEARYER